MDNIIDIAKYRQPAIRRVKEDALWARVCRDGIIPAFNVCNEVLCRQGKDPRICMVPPDDYYKKPNTLLVWHGAKAMRGIQLALHFTYFGSGEFRFDLSALKSEHGYRHQTSYFQDRFRASDQDFMAVTFHLSSFGLGLAVAMERAPLEPKWRVVNVPKDKLI